MNVYISGASGMIGKWMMKNMPNLYGINLEPYDPRINKDTVKQGAHLIHLGEKPISEKDVSLAVSNIEMNRDLCHRFEATIYASSQRVHRFLCNKTERADEYITRKLASESIFLSKPKNCVIRLPTVCDPRNLRPGTFIHKTVLAIKRKSMPVLSCPKAIVKIVEIDEVGKLFSDLLIRRERGEEIEKISEMNPTLSMRAQEIATGLKLHSEGINRCELEKWLAQKIITEYLDLNSGVADAVESVLCLFDRLLEND